MTTYTLRKGSPEKTRTDVVVIGVAQTDKALVAAPGGEGVASAYGRKFAPLLASMGFKGKAGEVAKIPTGGVLKSSTLLVVGMGPRDGLTTEGVRRAAGVAARHVQNAASVTLALPAVDEAHVRAVADGFRLGGYTFTRFKTAADPDPVSEVVILSDAARSQAAQDALATSEIVGNAVATARDWVNTPAGDLTPEIFASEVSSAKPASGRKRALTVTVLDEVALKKDAFGGILGVGQGSSNPPRLVRLDYSPKGATKHLALVGKGITFDSGGLSIKPGTGMMTMKCDMGGAAAVVAATFAIAELGLPIKVSTYAPMAENMISGNATRPGDVLTMYGGKTVEVLNTDAEGRLVLADALVKSLEEDPDLIVDVATLTGACQIALGDRVAGVLGNDDDVVGALEAAAATVGEQVWRLPITPEMGEKVRGNSKVADLMQHNMDRWGGALYAAAFLREFVDGRPWAHLDIAGPGFNDHAPWGHVTSGGTGFSVATLVQLAAACRRQADRRGGPPGASVSLLLLTAVVLPQACGDADHGRVVRRHAVVVGELVGPLDRGHPAAGPLPVVGDQEEGHVDTAVRGSTNPSTPRRALTHWSRCATSAPSLARTVVPPPAAGLRRLVPRRKRLSHPMGPSVAHAASRTAYPMWTDLRLVER